MNSSDLKHDPLSLRTLLGNPKSQYIPLSALRIDLVDSLLRMLTTGNLDVMSTASKKECLSIVNKSNSYNVHGNMGISQVSTESLLFLFAFSWHMSQVFTRVWISLLIPGQKTKSLALNLVLSTPK